MRAKEKSLGGYPPPPPPPPPRPTPRKGRCDEGSTDSAGRPRGVPTAGPTHATRVLGVRRGAGLITILLVRMLKVSHLPRVLWLLTGEARFAPNLTPVCALLPKIREV